MQKCNFRSNSMKPVYSIAARTLERMERRKESRRSHEFLKVQLYSGASGRMPDEHWMILTVGSSTGFHRPDRARRDDAGLREIPN